MSKVLVGIQARSASTRLPGKIFLPLGTSTVLESVYHQCYVAKFPEWITQYDVKVLGPTDDDKLVEFCKEKCLPYALGSHEDLVERYFTCSEGYDAIVRVTSDCPLIPTWMVEMVLTHLEKFDYVTNVNPRSFPDGFDCQAMKTAAYRFIQINSKIREHPFFELDTDPAFFKKFEELYTINKIVNGETFIVNPYLKSTKISIDTQEDYERVRSIVERKHPSQPGQESVGAR